AGVPMKDMVVSCASGKVENKICLDLMKEEDNFGDSDVPMALIPKTGEVVLFQMDGHMTYEEMEKAIDMSVKACYEIYDIQKAALKKRYTTSQEVE
ncbi:MAG: exosome complex exonuclease Rrp41, partial [Thermoplasmata archaeon]|nr:exosome complex exonuclease Rrp41 [Thermoplasmata archaeon]